MKIRNPKDIKIGRYTLKEILERHKHWAYQDCKNWESTLYILWCGQRNQRKRRTRAGLAGGYAYIAGSPRVKF